MCFLFVVCVLGVVVVVVVVGVGVVVGGVGVAGVVVVVVLASLFEVCTDSERRLDFGIDITNAFVFCRCFSRLDQAKRKMVSPCAFRLFGRAGGGKVVVAVALWMGG
jgi:hypothetical protein